MANPKGNPKTLKPYKPKWRSGKTQTIRVPIAIADKVLEAARLIDESNEPLLQVLREENSKSTPKIQSSTVTSNKGYFTDGDLAKMFGCNKSTIRRIRTGKIVNSKYLERLSKYEISGTHWIKPKNNDTSDKS